MKASLSWLKDYVNIRIPIEDLAEMLTMSGVHVEYIERVGNDYVLEFEITSNRSDCLSVIGIAREIAAITGEKLKVPPALKSKIQNPKSKINSDSKFQIKILDKKLCPRYTGRIINDVKVGPSPKWLQDKLILVGLRPVNNIVDITNFVLMETGQPMHAFDLDKIKGSVNVRKAKKKENIKTIDGLLRTFEEGMLVIADETSPIAIAGIMGGIDTEVSSSTKNILLESAYFDPVSVRKTSRKLGLSSESSYRFERKVDRTTVLPASERTLRLIKDFAGGKNGKLIDVGDKKVTSLVIKFNPKRSNKVLGVDIPTKKQKGILKKLGFSVVGRQRSLDVKPPSFRRDISQEVDLIEEVARIYNYNKIPHTIPKIIGHTELMDRKDIVKGVIRKTLSSIGLNEIISYNFVSEGMLEEFSVDKERSIRIQNPLNKEQDILTGALLPGMLKSISWNINRKNKNLCFFEIGNVYRKNNKKKFLEELHLSIGLSGLAEDDWLSEKRNVTFFDLKGIVMNLFEKLGLEKIEFIPDNNISYYSAGSKIKYKDKEIGSIGRLDENVLKKFDIEESVYALEIALEEIEKDAVLEKKFKPIPKFPSITRDISLVVDKNISAESIVRTIREFGRDIVKEITLIDIYSGKQIPDGKQGLLYRIEYRDDSKTLTDSEVEQLHNKIKEILSTKLGISFR